MNLVSIIDHAVLHPTATVDDLQRECQLAHKLGVASVCVKPYMVLQASKLLADSPVAVGTVIGFPHGGNTTSVKVLEAQHACDDGAVELDMVINIGKALDREWDYIALDIKSVLDVANENDALLKVIFETDYITDPTSITKLCEICTQLEVAFVKTSTGFGYTKQPSGDYNYAGAREADVQRMRNACGPQIGVKASGGIRSADDAGRMVELGATRLGTSASQAIADGDQGSSY